jgi:hypothetical protein
LPRPRIKRNEELPVGFSDVFILQIRESPKKPHCAKDLLLEYRCLQMTNDFQVLHAVYVTQVAGGLIVLEWVEDLKFH